MLTESQFREIADSLRDIVNELKKMNERTEGLRQVFHVNNTHAADLRKDVEFFNRYSGNFERSDHSGPSIA